MLCRPGCRYDQCILPVNTSAWISLPRAQYLFLVFVCVKLTCSEMHTSYLHPLNFEKCKHRLHKRSFMPFLTQSYPLSRRQLTFSSFHHGWVFPILGFYINGIIQCVLFCIILLLFAIVFWDAFILSFEQVLYSFSLLSGIPFYEHVTVFPLI